MASMEHLGHLHYKMMSRCYREKDVMYKDYGARGIGVCEEWHDRATFVQWCKDNGFVKGMRINRIDSSKDYSPDNCVIGNRNCKINGGKSQETKRNARERKQKKEEAKIKGKIREDELYVTYRGMHNRCEMKSHPSYKNYGGRGITVCSEWSGKDGFFNFKKWANENYWAEGLTLDRKDNDKGYSPDNCRFATIFEQNYNKRSNILYEYHGKVIPLGMIAKLENVKYGLLYSRVRQRRMSVNNALKEIKSGK